MDNGDLMPTLVVPIVTLRKNRFIHIIKNFPVLLIPDLIINDIGKMDDVQGALRKQANLIDLLEVGLEEL